MKVKIRHKRESYLQIRQLHGLQDDYSDQFPDIKTNLVKMFQFIELNNKFNPHATPLQVWRITTDKFIPLKQKSDIDED